MNSKSEKKIVKKVIQLNETSKLADKYQSIPFFKEMMVRHRYSHSKFDEILSHFAYLLKISSLYDDITKEKIIVNSDSKKEEQTISRLFEMTKLDPKEVKPIIDYGNYDSLFISIKVVKAYYKKISKIPYRIFLRMILSIEELVINKTKITILGFVKFR